MFQQILEQLKQNRNPETGGMAQPPWMQQAGGPMMNPNTGQNPNINPETGELLETDFESGMDAKFGGMGGMLGGGKMTGLLKFLFGKQSGNMGNQPVNVPNVENNLNDYENEGWYGGSSGTNSYGSQLPNPRDYSDMGY